MWDVLQRLQREGQLAYVERGFGNALCGFVGAVSDEFALINIVTRGCDFDGGTVIRTDDVEFVRWDTPDLRARSSAAMESPSAPEMLGMADLSSWLTVLDRFADEPVITLHREMDRDWHVATSVSHTMERVQADEIGEGGVIDGTIVFPLSDLTRVDFGRQFERSHARLLRSSRTAADSR